MKVLTIITTFLMLTSLCIAAEDHCDALKAIFKQRRKLSDGEIAVYCERNCNFIRKFVCPSEETSNESLIDFSSWMTQLEEFVSEVVAGEVDSPFFNVDMSPRTYGKLVTFFIPYLLSVVPIILQWIFIGSDAGRNAGNRAWLIVVNVICWIGYISFYWANQSACMAYSIYAYLSAFSVLHSRVFNELGTSFLCMAALIWLSLSNTSSFVQLIGGASICFLLFGVFFKAVQTQNESGRVSVLTWVATMSMSADFLMFLLRQLAIDNTAMAILQLCVDAVLPNGATYSFLTNAILSASKLVELLGWTDKIGVGGFFVSFISYFVLYFVSRCCIGMMVLSRLKFDWQPNALLTGLYSYMIDVVGPFQTVIMCFFDRDHRSSRRFMYGCLMLFFFSRELKNAHEVVFIRLFLWALDSIVIQSGLANASRFLEINIELTGIAFPKPGAFPFTSLDQLGLIRKACKRLTLTQITQNGDKDYSGVGTLIGPRDSVKLFTVRHNVMSKHRLSFDDGRYVEEVKTLNRVGASRDPAVTMFMISNPPDAVNVSLLSRREIRNVSYLLMISPEGMCSPITQWRFDDKGDLHATISLKQGDSGSPIVAIMKDGVIRLAGTVSRGTISEGSPNIISSVACDDDALRGSPGLSEPYLELMNVRTESDLRIAKVIEDMLSEEHDKWLAHFSDDLERWDEKIDNFNWDDLPPEDRNRKRNRVKSYRKDARARKQGFNSILDASCLSDEQKRIANDDFDGRKIRKFNIQRGQLNQRAGVGFVSAS